MVAAVVVHHHQAVDVAAVEANVNANLLHQAVNPLHLAANHHHQVVDAAVVAANVSVVPLHHAVVHHHLHHNVVTVVIAAVK